MLPAQPKRSTMTVIREFPRLIVAITGASGALYGVRALQVLREMGTIETHLILTASGARTLVEETDFSAAQVREMADRVHSPKDIGATLASGSFKTLGMLVAPCSIKTLSGIAHCYNEELVVRAADVCLKERRRVVLLLRETPLHAGHIALMAQATQNGAIIMPPVSSRPIAISQGCVEIAARCAASVPNSAVSAKVRSPASAAGLRSRSSPINRPRAIAAA